MRVYASVIFISYFGLSQLLAIPLDNDTEKVGIIEGAARMAALLYSPPRVKDAAAEEEVIYGLNLAYPLCPSTCLAEWITDGWCDSACASPECGNDGGDCEGWCAGDCKSEWLGDGFCDVDCFREECEWDKTDCAEKFTQAQLKIPLPSHKEFDYSSCPVSCQPALLHDGECNEACNVLACNFDGGDCSHQCTAGCANAWLGDGECDSACNAASCGFDKGDCKICAAGCEPGMAGNGVCDKVCEVADCDQDGSDCWGVCWAPPKIDYETEPFFYPHCRNEWKGDGACDCFCMTSQCEFDLGDCNGKDCSLEFALLREYNTRMNITYFPLSYGPALQGTAGR